jgi:hypothetical protein
MPILGDLKVFGLGPTIGESLRLKGVPISERSIGVLGVVECVWDLLL